MRFIHLDGFFLRCLMNGVNVGGDGAILKASLFT